MAQRSPGEGARRGGKKGTAASAFYSATHSKGVTPAKAGVQQPLRTMRWVGHEIRSLLILPSDFPAARPTSSGSEHFLRPG
jgi:hypothetical protein